MLTDLPLHKTNLSFRPKYDEKFYTSEATARTVCWYGAGDLSFVEMTNFLFRAAGFNYIDLTQIFLKLNGLLLSPWACSLMDAGPWAL